MNPSDKLKEIETRVNARPGEETFDPAYMFANPYNDALWLIARIKELEKINPEDKISKISGGFI